MSCILSPIGLSITHHHVFIHITIIHHHQHHCIIICREPSMHTTTNKAVVSSGLGAGTRAAHSGQIAAPGPRMDGYADAQAADPPTVRGLKAGSGAQ